MWLPKAINALWRGQRDVMAGQFTKPAHGERGPIGMRRGARQHAGEIDLRVVQPHCRQHGGKQPALRAGEQHFAVLAPRARRPAPSAAPRHCPRGATRASGGALIQPVARPATKARKASRSAAKCCGRASAVRGGDGGGAATCKAGGGASSIRQLRRRARPASLAAHRRKSQSTPASRHQPRAAAIWSCEFDICALDPFSGS